jgi:hypothetical protein
LLPVGYYQGYFAPVNEYLFIGNGAAIGFGYGLGLRAK